jgi:hypothetical protein
MRRERALWPPLAAWSAAALFLLGMAVATGHDPFQTRVWARWDSGLYFDIARHGYTVFPCPTEPGDWCGNAAWFPLYPWLIRCLHAVGLPLAPAAIVLSWLLTAATLVLLWICFLDRRLTLASGIVLVYAAFAPGQVFDFAAYPLALLTLATVAHFALLARGRWVAAGLAGFAAALSYPLGLLLAPAAAVWLLAGRRAGLAERARRAAIVAGLTAAGGIVVVLVQRIDTGRWNAFFLVQAKYEHHWQTPLTTVRAARYAVAQTAPSLFSARPAQTLFVALVVACCVAAVAVAWRRVGQIEVLIALWVVLAWALPHAETGVSLYRSEAALLPAALLLRRLPRPLALLFAAAAVALAVPMAKLFLTGRLQ